MSNEYAPHNKIESKKLKGILYSNFEDNYIVSLGLEIEKTLKTSEEIITSKIMNSTKIHYNHEAEEIIKMILEKGQIIDSEQGIAYFQLMNVHVFFSVNKDTINEVSNNLQGGLKLDFSDKTPIYSEEWFYKNKKDLIANHIEQFPEDKTPQTSNFKI